MSWSTRPLRVTKPVICSVRLRSFTFMAQRRAAFCSVVEYSSERLVSPEPEVAKPKYFLARTYRSSERLRSVSCASA